MPKKTIVVSADMLRGKLQNGIVYHVLPFTIEGKRKHNIYFILRSMDGHYA